MSTRYDDIISDMYKDAHGSRPRADWCRNFGRMTDAEQDAEVAYLQRLIEDSIRDEQEMNRQAESQFKVDIANLQANGASDEATAIRWYVDALGLVEGDLKFYGASYICHTAGLPYYMAQVFVDSLGIHHG